MTSLPSPASPLPFLLHLLPNLLSPYAEPLRLEQLSAIMALRHKFLLSPASPTSAEYYQSVTPPSTVVETRRIQLVEGGEGMLCEGGAPVVLWRVDPEDGIIAQATLGRSEAVILGVSLKWELIEGELGWRFNGLELPATTNHFARPRYYTSLDEAMAEHLAPPVVLPINISGSSSNSAARRAEVPVEEMAQGEGTTPGAYGTAEDFWSGYRDDQAPLDGQGLARQKEMDEYEFDSDEENQTGFCMNSVNADRRYEPQDVQRGGTKEHVLSYTKREVSDDEQDNSYWDGYGSDSNSAVGYEGGDGYGQSTLSTPAHYYSSTPAPITAAINSEEVAGRDRSATLQPSTLSARLAGDSTSNTPLANLTPVPPGVSTFVTPYPPLPDSSTALSAHPIDSTVGAQQYPSSTNATTQVATKMAVRGLFALYAASSSLSQVDQRKAFIELVSGALDDTPLV